MPGIYIGTRSDRAQPSSLDEDGVGQSASSQTRPGVAHTSHALALGGGAKREQEQERKGGATAKSRPSPDKLGKRLRRQSCVNFLVLLVTHVPAYPSIKRVT